jgi:hypothetical protein
VPASRANPLAAAHGAGAAPRPAASPGLLLSRLCQFSGGRLPGYTGHKARDGPGVRAGPPPPTAATTQGFVDLEVRPGGIKGSPLMLLGGGVSAEQHQPCHACQPEGAAQAPLCLTACRRRTSPARAAVAQARPAAARPCALH